MIGRAETWWSDWRLCDYPVRLKTGVATAWIVEGTLREVERFVPHDFDSLGKARSYSPNPAGGARSPGAIYERARRCSRRRLTNGSCSFGS